MQLVMINQLSRENESLPSALLAPPRRRSVDERGILGVVVLALVSITFRSDEYLSKCQKD